MHAPSSPQSDTDDFIEEGQDTVLGPKDRRHRRKTPLDPTTSSENDEHYFSARSSPQRKKCLSAGRYSEATGASPCPATENHRTSLKQRVPTSLPTNFLPQTQLYCSSLPTRPDHLKIATVPATSLQRNRATGQAWGLPRREEGSVQLHAKSNTIAQAPHNLSTSPTKRKKSDSNSPTYKRVFANDEPLLPVQRPLNSCSLESPPKTPRMSIALGQNGTDTSTTLHALMATTNIDDAPRYRNRKMSNPRPPRHQTPMGPPLYSLSLSGRTSPPRNHAPSILSTTCSSPSFPPEKEFSAAYGVCRGHDIPEIVITPTLMTFALESELDSEEQSPIGQTRPVLQSTQNFVQLSKVLHERQEADNAWKKRFENQLAMRFTDLMHMTETQSVTRSTARVDSCVSQILSMIQDPFLSHAEPSKKRRHQCASPSLQRFPLTGLRELSPDGGQGWIERLFLEEQEATLTIIISLVFQTLSTTPLPLALPETMAYLCNRVAQSLSQSEKTVQDQAAKEPLEGRPLTDITTSRRVPSSWRNDGVMRPSTPVTYRRSTSVEYRAPGALNAVSGAPTCPDTTMRDGSETLLQAAGSTFLHLLKSKLDGILALGDARKDLAGRLVVPPMPRNTTRWKAYLGSSKQSRDNRFKEKASSLRQVVSLDDLSRQQRARAVEGDLRDAFTSAYVVRFVGELYCIGLIDLVTVERWIYRMLFDTAYPGTPSLWELECGCVLLITIMPRLHEFQYRAEEQTRSYVGSMHLCIGKADGRSILMQRSFSAPSHKFEPDSGAPSARELSEQRKATEDDDSWSTVDGSLSDSVLHIGIAAAQTTTTEKKALPKGHWLEMTPSQARRSTLNTYQLMMANDELAQGKLDKLVEEGAARPPSNVTAAKLLRVSLSRLRELQRQPEIHEESKAWIEEVCALSERERSKWQAETAERWPYELPSSMHRLAVEARQQQHIAQKQDAARMKKLAATLKKRDQAKRRKRKPLAKKSALKEPFPLLSTSF